MPQVADAAASTLLPLPLWPPAPAPPAPAPPAPAPPAAPHPAGPPPQHLLDALEEKDWEKENAKTRRRKWYENHLARKRARCDAGLFFFYFIVVLHSFASPGHEAGDEPISVAPSPAEVVVPSSSAADVPDAAGLYFLYDLICCSLILGFMLHELCDT